MGRKNTIAIIGLALGDEGKGRIVDNYVSLLLKKKSIKTVYLVRFQGGSNAGHTVEFEGHRIGLHQVPSGVFNKGVVGLMDRGMVIHVEDLRTEVKMVEELLGDISGRLFLSEEAILVTDVERAEEWLNRKKQGKASGGTGRGIGPSYAHHYDRLGLHIHDLLDESWEDSLGYHYDRYIKEFQAYGEDLKSVEIPDFAASKKTKSAVFRTVGSKKEYLKRLQEVRDWLVKKKLARNLFPLHEKIYRDKTAAVIFEGAQAMGLHPWLGTIPDVTASNTSIFGLQDGTGFWRVNDVETCIGVFKLTYTSSVGARRMPTHVDLPKDFLEKKDALTKEQQWAAYVVTEAHEYGTTTGRKRDVIYLDLPMLSYMVRMSGVHAFAGTHLDIAREGEAVKICIGYKDKKGNPVSYQPGLRYLNDVIPQYVELPGWDGASLKKIGSYKKLPTNAKKYLAFLEKQLKVPVFAVTTGAGREHFLMV